MESSAEDESVALQFVNKCWVALHSGSHKS